MYCFYQQARLPESITSSVPKDESSSSNAPSVLPQHLVRTDSSAQKLDKFFKPKGSIDYEKGSNLVSTSDSQTLNDSEVPSTSGEQPPETNRYFNSEFNSQKS